MKTFKEYITEEKDSSIDEVASIATRLKRKQNIRKYKSKLKLGRLRASKRTASQDVLKKRARRAARTILFKKLVKGKAKGDLAYSARASYEKLINRRAGAIKAIARRLVPKARKAEMDRKMGRRARIIPGSN